MNWNVRYWRVRAGVKGWHPHLSLIRGVRSAAADSLGSIFMIAWWLGLIAECSRYAARFHGWRRRLLIDSARRAGDAEERALDIADWAEFQGEEIARRIQQRDAQ